MKSLIDRYVQEVKRSIEELGQQDLSSIVDVLYETYLSHRKVFVLGNGGSASTATHLAVHLRVGLIQGEKGGLLAESLTDNIPTITALANDFSYEKIFSAQLENVLNPQDVVVAISGSGNSKNVLAAAATTRAGQGTLIAVTGFGGGVLAGLADLKVVLSSNDYGPIEDVHTSFVHLVTYLLRKRITDG